MCSVKKGRGEKMIKLQQFFMRYKKQLLLVNTILLLLAEGSKWLLRMNLPYQALMLIVGIVGVLPIALTAISSLRVKLISIDVLVSLAVIGAFIIGEFNEEAVKTSFLLGKFAFRNQDQVKDMEEFILNGIEQLLPLYGKLEC